MRDNLSIVVMIIVLVLLAVLFPLYNYFERQDDMSYNLVLKATTNFVDEVINCGYISQKMYDDYVANISNTGNLYDIRLEAKRKVLIQKDDGFEEQYAVDYNDEIFKQTDLSNVNHIDSRTIKDGIYKLNVGDQIYVKLVNSSTSMATAILNMIAANVGDEYIKVNYGGIVKNNAWESAAIDEIVSSDVTVSYNTKGGEPSYIEPSNGAIYLGAESANIKITYQRPSLEDYAFIGWTDEINGTTVKYNPGSNYSFKNNITLYAVYKSKVRIRVKDTVTGMVISNGNWTNKPVTIELENAQNILYRIGETSYTAYTNRFTYMNEGSITLYAKPSDSSIISQYNINIDTTAPTTPGNINVIKNSTNSFTAESSGSIDSLSGVAGYEYSVDGVNYQSSGVFNNMENKRYQVYARAKDKAGNVSTVISKEYNNKIDNIGIILTLNTKDWTNSDVWVTAKVSGKIPDGYVLQYRIGNSSWNDLSMGGYGTYADSTYREVNRFRVTSNGLVSARFYNKVTGNTIFTTAVWVQKIDREKPVITRTDTYSIGETYVGLSVSAIDKGNSGTARYMYSKDGINYQSSPYFYGLNPGTRYTFYAKVYDHAGNVSDVRSISVTTKEHKENTTYNGGSTYHGGSSSNSSGSNSTYTYRPNH